MDVTNFHRLPADGGQRMPRTFSRPATPSLCRFVPTMIIKNSLTPAEVETSELESSGSPAVMFTPAPNDAPPSFLEKPEPATADYAPLERSSLQLYMHEIGKTPLLKLEEEVVLARRIRRGDRAARDHMIKANLRLVVKIAMDYKDFGLPLLDLISEGNIGLLKGVGRFDPAKVGEAAGCASWWIKRSITRALANHSKTIPPHGSPAGPMKSRVGRNI